MEAETGFSVVNILFQGLEYLLPLIVAFLTVPIFGWFKKVQTWLGKMPPSVQQVFVATLAGVLTWLGTFLNVVLPSDLTLFGTPEVSALLSSGMAYALHAGKKATELKKKVE